MRKRVNGRLESSPNESSMRRSKLFLGGYAHSPVEDAGWSMLEYKAWVFSAQVRELLDADVDSDAVADLSFAELVD